MAAQAAKCVTQQHRGTAALQNVYRQRSYDVHGPQQPPQGAALLSHPGQQAQQQPVDASQRQPGEPCSSFVAVVLNPGFKCVVSAQQAAGDIRAAHTGVFSCMFDCPASLQLNSSDLLALRSHALAAAAHARMVTRYI